MEEGDKYICENERLQAEEPIQLHLPLHSTQWWLDYSISPSSCLDHHSNPQQTLCLPISSISNNFWNVDNIESGSGYGLPNTNEYPILPCESSSSFSSGSSSLASPLGGTIGHQSFEPDTFHDIEANAFCKSPVQLQWTHEQFPNSTQPSTTPQPPTQLPKKQRPPILNSEPSYRHNLVERKYRSKLNTEYETLLSVLPPELIAEVNEARKAVKQPEKSLSKSEVLELAKEHIQMLEMERKDLENQNKVLGAEIEMLMEVWLGSEEGGG